MPLPIQDNVWVLKHILRLPALVFLKYFLVFGLWGAACSNPKLQIDAQPSSQPLSNEAGQIPPTIRDDFRVELSSHLVADGSLLRITVWPKKGQKILKVEGQFEKIKFPFYMALLEGVEVHEGLLGVPFGHIPGDAVVVLLISDTEPQEITSAFKITDGNYPTEKLKVLEKHVSPNAVALIRIRQEQAEIAAIYQRGILKKFWQGPFQLPIQSEITSPYGSKRVFNGQLNRFHGGLDLRAQVGTPVLAGANGTAVLSKDLYYTGLTVILDHGYGIFTIYAHLSQLDIKRGGNIKIGQRLGLSGKTGRVTGAHLHWQAMIHREKINPLDLLKWMR